MQNICDNNPQYLEVVFNEIPFRQSANQDGKLHVSVLQTVFAQVARYKFVFGIKRL